MATAQKTALDHDKKAEMADESDEESQTDESAELASFRSSFPRLASLLEAEVLSVSTAAFQEALIDIDLFTAVTNKTVFTTAKSQILDLLTTLYRKMQTNPAKAQAIMDKFMEIMKTESAYNGVLKLLRKGLSKQKGKTPHLTVFQKNMVAISGTLEGGVSDLALHCHSKNLISAKQMATLTNPGAINTQRYICMVLEQIQKKIEEDPENLDLFIKKVLEPMGPFADKLISQLREQEEEPMEDIDIN